MPEPFEQEKSWKLEALRKTFSYHDLAIFYPRGPQTMKTHVEKFLENLVVISKEFCDLDNMNFSAKSNNQTSEKLQRILSNCLVIRVKPLSPTAAYRLTEKGFEKFKVFMSTKGLKIDKQEMLRYQKIQLKLIHELTEKVQAMQKHLI